LSKNKYYFFIFLKIFFLIADTLSVIDVNQKINNKSEFTVKEAILLRNLIREKTLKKYTIEELFADTLKEET